MSEFSLGMVSANTRAELGVNAVAHVGLLTTDTELSKNIGRMVRFLPRDGQGTIHRELHQIVAIQKMWGNDLETGKYSPNRIGYRVIVADTDDFGRCALPEDIEFTD